jgi:hypothetical protein
MTINGKPHFYVNFKKKFTNTLLHEVSSANAERLNEEELKQLITVLPKL